MRLSRVGLVTSTFGVRPAFLSPATLNSVVCVTPWSSARPRSMQDSGSGVGTGGESRVESDRRVFGAEGDRQ